MTTNVSNSFVSSKISALSLTSCVMLIIATSFSNRAQAASIGINWVGETGSGGVLAPGDSAGETSVAQANWNNTPGDLGITPGAGSDQFPSILTNPLNDSTGTPTANTTYNWYASNNWVSTVSGGTAGDQKMMNGNFFFNNVAGQIEVFNIPYSQYDVYLYVAGQSSNTGGVGSATVSSNTTFWKRDSVFAGSWTEATAITQATAFDSNYLKWTGETSSTLTIDLTTFNGDNVSVQGLQIVDSSSPAASGTPEPSTFVLAVLGMFSLTFVGLRRHNRRTA